MKSLAVVVFFGSLSRIEAATAMASAGAGQKLFTTGSRAWPAVPCRKPFIFGLNCNSREKYDGDMWASAVCQYNGFAYGEWTGRSKDGCDLYKEDSGQVHTPRIVVCQDVNGGGYWTEACTIPKRKIYMEANWDAPTPYHKCARVEVVCHKTRPDHAKSVRSEQEKIIPTAIPTAVPTSEPTSEPTVDNSEPIDTLTRNLGDLWDLDKHARNRSKREDEELNRLLKKGSSSTPSPSVVVFTSEEGEWTPPEGGDWHDSRAWWNQDGASKETEGKITPTRRPTRDDSLSPTRRPTANPTLEPTAVPTQPPSKKPTLQPTLPKPTIPFLPDPEKEAKVKIVGPDSETKESGSLMDEYPKWVMECSKATIAKDCKKVTITNIQNKKLKNICKYSKSAKTCEPRVLSCHKIGIRSESECLEASDAGLNCKPVYIKSNKGKKKSRRRTLKFRTCSGKLFL